MKLRSIRTARVAVVALATFAAVSFAASASAEAASYTVSSTSDPAVSSCSGTVCPSLRDAVAAADTAGGASTITLGSGTFKLTIPAASGHPSDPATGDLDIDNDASVTITGSAAGSTIIDPNESDRAFAVHPGASLSVSQLTIEDGETTSSSPAGYSFMAGEGGAIINGGVLTITDCSLTGNTSTEEGGAIYSDSTATSTTITGSTLSDNATEGAGGALYVGAGSGSLSGDTLDGNVSSGGPGGAVQAEEMNPTTGSLSVSGSTLEDNSASGTGGAIDLNSIGPSSVTSSVLSGNQGESTGGAISADDTGELTVTGSTFDDDGSGDDPGGAIYTGDSDLALSASEFSDDSGSPGGAVYLEATSPSAQESIAQSAFTGNHSPGSGGAIFNSDGDLTLSSSTLADNTSSQDGGGFDDSASGGLTMTNDTLSGNHAQDGGGIYFNDSVSGGSGLLNDTIVDNGAFSGGGIYEPDDAGGIENTIVAGNSAEFLTAVGGGDCWDPANYEGNDADKGHNLDDDGSCFGGASPFAPGDKSGAAVALDPLAANGGPVQTVGLPAGSAAIGAADGADCPITDARGVARSAGSCDAGAFQTAPADLALTVSAPSKVAAGGAISYRFIVTNNGPGPATGVRFDDTIPGNATYFVAATSQGTCSGTGTVECSLGTINSASTGGAQPVTISIIVAAGKSGSISDTGSVGGTQTDPNTGNNSASATTTVTPATSTKTAIAPLVFTGSASKVKSTQANVGGIVNPAGQSTTYYVQYGTSKHYGKTTKSVKLSAGTKSKTVTVTIKGLKKHTRYHFRLVARNTAGTSNGADGSFKTS